VWQEPALVVVRVQGAPALYYAETFHGPVPGRSVQVAGRSVSLFQSPTRAGMSSVFLCKLLLIPILAAVVIDSMTNRTFSMLVVPVSRSTMYSAHDNIGSGSGSALHPAVLSVAVFATAISSFVSATSIFMHLKNYRKPMLQR
jgi:hypothetical protein